MVGIARTLTDFTYVAYLADLAVDVEFQRLGIGTQLIEETRSRLGPDCMLVLLAAPKANDYYPKLGFEQNPRAWVLKATKEKARACGPGQIHTFGGEWRRQGRGYLPNCCSATNKAMIVFMHP